MSPSSQETWTLSGVDGGESSPTVHAYIKGLFLDIAMIEKTVYNVEVGEAVQKVGI